MSSTRQLFSNNAATTASIQVLATDTQITVADASAFSNPGNNGTYILVTLENSGVIEIVKISNITGNVLTVYGGLSGRGQEGTTAAVFPVGTLVENRVTADTLEGFLDDEVYLPKLSSVSNLSDPASMDGKAYMAGSDDGGALVLAYASTPTLWNFPSYSLLYSGAATSGNTTSAVITESLGTYTAGKYIVQFTNGSLEGYPRAITGISGTTISWSTALPNSVSTNTYEIYQSNFSNYGGSGGGGGSGSGGYRGDIISADGTALTTTTLPTFSSYTDGLEVNGYIVQTNWSSTTPTLNANGLGAKTVAKLDDEPLLLCELSGEVTFRFNSSIDKFLLVSSIGSGGISIQIQEVTAFTTTGSSTAYLLTPTPSIFSNAANLRFRVKFHTAAGTSPTLEVSGAGALNLMYRLSDGSKVAVTSAQIPADWVSDVENDGTDWVLLDRADLATNFFVIKPNLTDDGTDILIGDLLVTAGAFNYSITQDINLPFPTTVPEAGTFYIDVTMDATGGRLLSFDSSYHLVPNGSVWQTSPNCINRVWLVVRTPSVIDVYIENIVY